QAAAIVSGAVALVLQRYPTMTPDLVKRYFWSNAVKLASFDSQAQGGGEIRLGKMLGTAPQWSYGGQNFTAATGTGPIEIARGQDHLTTDGVTLTGEQDIFGSPIDPSSLAALEASGHSWSTDGWNGHAWSASDWAGHSWSGHSWSESSWSST